MWFMNHIANPIVCLILRSPLHGLFSAALLLITYRGRKSGKEYTLPVQYVQAGNTLYIVPGMPERKTWWRNLKGGLPVQVTLRGQVLNGNGRLLDPKRDAAEIVTGLGQYLQRFPPSAKARHVRTEASGALNAEDVGKAAERIVMIRVELNEIRA
jgi:deazaflavin-dependent oxidoreductase (nitroreductase family)